MIVWYYLTTEFLVLILHGLAIDVSKFLCDRDTLTLILP